MDIVRGRLGVGLHLSAAAQLGTHGRSLASQNDPVRRSVQPIGVAGRIGRPKWGRGTSRLEPYDGASQVAVIMYQCQSQDRIGDPTTRDTWDGRLRAGI
jgi:hypothetical protein